MLQSNIGRLCAHAGFGSGFSQSGRMARPLEDDKSGAHVLVDGVAYHLVLPLQVIHAVLSGGKEVRIRLSLLKIEILAQKMTLILVNTHTNSVNYSVIFDSILTTFNGALFLSWGLS